jgi:hypothetical protein
VLPYLPMACPCFYPVERIRRTGQKSPPGPLGDVWSGICQAQPESEWRPDSATAQQFCNFGYARQKCPRFHGEGADAVRFAISRDEDGVIAIVWVAEKDHLPFAHGPLEYSREEARLTASTVDARVAQQAQAYISSYLLRKQELRRA